MAFDPTLTTALLTALTPTVAVFIGILLQRQDIRDLRTDMSRLQGEMRAEMVSLRNQVHADMLLIHERVAKVEARQGQ